MRAQARPPCCLAGTQATSARRGPATRDKTAETVPIALGWELANGVLALTATTPGQAAICHDSWSVSPSLALTAVTIDDASVPGETTYVSRAAVDGSSLAHDTTYTFSYAIVMRTGESLWVGSRSLTVTVGRDGSMTEPARAAEPPQA